jgi:hypothetical protein
MCAKESLHAIPVIDDYSLMENLLLPLEQATKKAVTEQGEVLKFLDAYK